MSQLATWLWRACSDLGLRIELGFKLTLDDDRVLCTLARLPDLGAPRGMLVIKSYDEISDCAEQVTAAGFGYAVLDEPAAGEQFDGDSFREMFLDWGWSGELGCKPAWMR